MEMLSAALPLKGANSLGNLEREILIRKYQSYNSPRITNVGEDGPRNGEAVYVRVAPFYQH